MPKNSDVTLAQEQMKIKPQIEEIISELLDGSITDFAFVPLTAAVLTMTFYTLTTTMRAVWNTSEFCFTNVL